MKCGAAAAKNVISGGRIAETMLQGGVSEGAGAGIYNYAPAPSQILPVVLARIQNKSPKMCP